MQAHSKGVRGLVTLRRAFRSVDPSGSGHIPVDKFRRVLASCHITLTDKVRFS